jgi:hypothetical protein
MRLAAPDQPLMGAGQHLDRLGQVAVTGHRPMVVPVGAHQIRQHLGVPSVGLGARQGVPVAPAGDRIDLVAGRARAADAGRGPAVLAR